MGLVYRVGWEVYTYLVSILDIIFPKNCLECRRPGSYICKNCLVKVAKAAPICPRCQRSSIDGVTHFACRRKLGLDGLTSIWLYEGVIRKAILAMKYKFAADISRELVRYALADLRSLKLPLDSNTVLIPIPLHQMRYNWRGFNQSEEMGRLIAKSLGLKFDPNLLIRKRITLPQTELNQEARLKNLRDVFALAAGRKPTTDSFMLFDDVFTTGSTLKEAAKVLKRGGAKRVWGLTIAR